MRKINKIKIFTSETPKSKQIKNKLEIELKKHKLIISDDCDLAVAIGGDGTFINMVKSLEFNSHIYYVGINTGTLGFLQDISPEDINKFVESINTNNFKTQKISLQNTKIITKDKTYNCHSLNEIVIRNDKFKTTYLTIKVNGKLLEKFAGDGILISTGVGSTAYNTSLGGAMVSNDIHAIQITPIAPLINKTTKSLRNALILSENNIVTIEPNYKKDNDLLVIIDGTSDIYKDVIHVTTKVGKEKITCLRMHNYDYIDKIREKFLN